MHKNVEEHGMVHFVPVLDPALAQKYADKVMSLSNLWITQIQYFNTFGAVTYLEAFNEKGVLPYSQLGPYHAHKALMNPVFKRHFSSLYEQLCTSLSEHLNTPCQLIDDLGLPGFHIYGATKSEGQMDQQFIDSFVGDSWSHLHVDIQYLPHQPVWDQFSEVDLVNPLTFTLSLQLPESGSALRFWHSIESPTEAQAFNYTPLDERAKMIGEANLAKYAPGVLTYFIGHLIHQIPAANPLKATDRRITLQGHGIKCDGIWRLYF